MSLKTILCATAEGAVADARGRATLVGVEPQIWGVPQLGATITPFFVIIAQDDPESPILRPGEAMHMEVTATAPDGETVYVHKQDVPAPPKADPTVPHRLQFFIQVTLQASLEGEYRLRVDFSAGDEEYTWDGSVPVRLER